MMSLIQKFQTLPRFRLGVLLVGLLGLSGVVSSLFAQYVLGMNPCVMCIQQRMALLGIALLAFLAWWLPNNKIGRVVAALLMSAPAVFGLYIASQQIYLQSLPLSEQPSCGAPWTFRWRNAPLLDWYEWFIHGTGACGDVYHVLGISLPTWGALFFAAILLLIGAAWWQTRRLP